MMGNGDGKMMGKDDGDIDHSKNQIGREHGQTETCLPPLLLGAATSTFPARSLVPCLRFAPLLASRNFPLVAVGDMPARSGVGCYVSRGILCFKRNINVKIHRVCINGLLNGIAA